MYVLKQLDTYIAQSFISFLIEILILTNMKLIGFISRFTSIWINFS